MAKAHASAPPAGNQDETLGQQLTQQFAAPGAQRLPYAELALPRRIARQRQHHYVGQSNQQHKPHHRHQNAQRAAVLHVIAGKALGIRQAQHRRLLTLHGRPAQADIRRGLKQRLKLRQRLRPVHTGSKPSDQPHAPPGLVGDIEFAVFRRITPRIQLSPILQWNPEVSRPARLNTFKAFCGNAHNGDGHAANVERLSQHVWVASEAPRPIVVADYGDGRVSSLVRISEAAAQRQIHAQPREECPAHHVAFSLFGLGPIAHGHFAIRERHKRHEQGECLVLLPQRVVHGVGKRLLGVDGACPARRIGRPQIHQALWIAYRQRFEQHCIHHTEHRGIGADSQRQRQDRSDRKPRTLQQRTQAEAQIAPHLVQPHKAAPDIEALLRCPHIAELAPRLPFRVVAVQAFALQVVGLEFQVCLNLRAKIFRTALAL